jgi:hypothetical protein
MEQTRADHKVRRLRARPQNVADNVLEESCDDFYPRGFRMLLRVLSEAAAWFHYHPLRDRVGRRSRRIAKQLRPAPDLHDNLRLQPGYQVAEKPLASLDHYRLETVIAAVCVRISAYVAVLAHALTHRWPRL